MRFAKSTLWLALLPRWSVASQPTLTIINSTYSSVSNGDDFVMYTNSTTGYTRSMVYKGNELVKTAVGGYSDTGGKLVYNFTLGPPRIVQQTAEMIDVAYESYEGVVHYVMFSGLSGFYHYIVNKNLRVQGEARSLYRFDPLQFSHGRTNIKNGPLPLLADIKSAFKVQDETWQRPNGSYITKYDWSCFVRSLDFHGVYGVDSKVGAWIIAPGKDYYIGDQLKQELMLHRESKTNDTVLLHMYHGSHYNSEFSNYIPSGKMFGPWLVYFNDGNITDASQRAALESQSWPYSWVQDQKFQSRGTVSGTLLLSDGRPAAGAAVFLGDDGNTNNQGSTYQYTSYASAEGVFSFENVRTEKQYTLQAWSDGGIIGDVQTVYTKSNITVSLKGETQLGKIVWPTSKRVAAWQIGEFDRKTLGFKNGGGPLVHGLSDHTPANFVYVVGQSNSSIWPFAQSAMGNWTILFDVPANRTNSSATLSLSFAGYTSQNGYGLGGDSYILPEVIPTGLNISVNAKYVDTVVSETATDGALYRSATTAGGYFYREFTIPTGLMGTANARIDL